MNEKRVFDSAYDVVRDSIINLARLALREDQVQAWIREQDQAFREMLNVVSTLNSYTDTAVQRARAYDHEYADDAVQVGALRLYTAIDCLGQDLEGLMMIALNGGPLDTKRNSAFANQLARRIGRMWDSVHNEIASIPESGAGVP